MLTNVARTNLAQKHLGELIKILQSTPTSSARSTLEMSFTLMMNRALGAILLEVMDPDAIGEHKLEEDFLSLLSTANLSDQYLTQLADGLRNPQHWLFHWHGCWQSLLVAPSNNIEAQGVNLITSTAERNNTPDAVAWYQNFNELVVNLRAQNEYC